VASPLGTIARKSSELMRRLFDSALRGCRCLLCCSFTCCEEASADGWRWRSGACRLSRPDFLCFLFFCLCPAHLTGNCCYG